MTSDYERDYTNLPFEDILRTYRGKNIIEKMLQYASKTILEIGSGPRPLFNDFSEFEKMIVVEPRSNFYKIAKDQAANKNNIIVFNDYIENISSELKSYDIDFILIGGFIHEIENNTEVLATIREISNGNTAIYNFVPNARSFHRLLAFEMGLIESVYQKSENDIRFQRQTVFDSDSFNGLMTDNGFEVVDSGSYFIKPFTHDQMVSLLKQDIISKRILDGLDRMGHYLPDMGAELWNISQKSC